MIVFPAIETLSFAPLPTNEHGRGEWRNQQDLPVRMELFGQTIDLIIPSGFITDGASIPWWARGEFDVCGKNFLPALLHDYLLNSHVELRKWNKDILFYVALRDQGVPELHAAIMYVGVRTR